jgi:hypothetical protein
MPITFNGNGTVTGLAVGGLPDGCVDADTLASGLAAQGIQEMDQWRLNANKQLTTSWSAVSANLERQDNTFSTHIGTGMSESSGVFTFPSTGKWLVQANGYLYSSNNEMHYGQVRTLVSSDSGSNYTIVGYAIGNASSGGAYGNFNSIELIDVTNTSTFRLKFDVRSGAGGNDDFLVGYTGENATSFIFTRFGGT